MKTLFRRFWRVALVAAAAIYVTGPQLDTSGWVYLELTNPHVQLFSVDPTKPVWSNPERPCPAVMRPADWKGWTQLLLNRTPGSPELPLPVSPDAGCEERVVIRMEWEIRGFETLKP
jgi:hypothetical protein